jgi:hypothetical protein
MKFDFEQIVRDVFPRFFAEIDGIQSSEANYAALLYHCLVSGGYSPKQLCTEMYTANLVKEGVRPDLVVFDEAISGRFNYYKDCDKNQDNTQLKIANLKCVIEIKGGAQQHESGLGKYFRDDPLCINQPGDPQKRKKTQNCQLAIDVEKLGMWASKFGRSNQQEYVFLAIDMRNPKGFWPDEVRNTFARYCAEHRVTMIYYAQGSHSFWHHDASGNSRKIPVKLQMKEAVQ